MISSILLFLGVLLFSWVVIWAIYILIDDWFV